MRQRRPLTDSQAVTVCHGHPELTLPLVCDSPHSGIRYPHDFGHSIALAELRRDEDTHVDRLFGHAPEVGATLVTANFPRTYIDANRALCDIDLDMLDGDWPQPLSATVQTKLGFGLIWRQVRAGIPIYKRKLSVAEVLARIDNCWRPYHAAVREATNEAMLRFGCCWHLNLHSVPSNAYARLGIVSPVPLADFVLGDRRGTSCERGFVAVLKQALEAHGYRVAVNDPDSGQELVRLNGRPFVGRHSLQIEVNRAIYMNELTRETSVRFDRVCSDLSSVLETLASYVRSRCANVLA